LGNLSGIKVLDLSRNIPGPACTWLLRGQGAAVDMVEAPGRGDQTRQLPPFIDGVGAFYAALNRGKRSLEIDLKVAAGQALIRRMVPHYDVVVEGFRPDVMEAFDLAPDRLLAINPRLVLVRISGFGGTGPWRRRPGHDLNFVAISGQLVPPAQGGALSLPLVQVADYAGAMMAAFQVTAALYERERTGRGQVLDISMTEAALLMMAPHVTALTAESREAQPGGELLSGGLGLYNCYRCGDGRWLALAALEPRFAAQVLEVVGTVDEDELCEAFGTSPREHWLAQLGEACCAPVLGVSELSTHPQLKSRGAVFERDGVAYVRPLSTEADGEVPRLGQHTDVVLRECGLGDHDR